MKYLIIILFAACAVKKPHTGAPFYSDGAIWYDTLPPYDSVVIPVINVTQDGFDWKVVKISDFQCTHIWVQVFENIPDTVEVRHGGLVHSIYNPPPEYQQGSEFICLACYTRKRQVIHNIRSTAFGVYYDSFRLDTTPSKKNQPK